MVEGFLEGWWTVGRVRVWSGMWDVDVGCGKWDVECGVCEMDRSVYQMETGSARRERRTPLQSGCRGQATQS